MIKKASAERFLSFAFGTHFNVINTENIEFVVCLWSLSK